MDELKRNGEKKDGGRKKVATWAEELVEERDRTEAAREKAMNKYYDACSNLESARTKHSRAPRDDKHLPRLLKSYKSALVDKNNARNEYILALRVANCTKRTFYDRVEATQDHDRQVAAFPPGISRCEDELQAMYHASVGRLNTLLSLSASVYSHFHTAQSQHCTAITQIHEAVNPATDSDLYAEWNMRTFSDPPEQPFEACPGFFEQGTLTCGEGDNLGFDEPTGQPGLGPSGGSSSGEELIVLQNRLARNREARAKLASLCDGWRAEIRKGRGVVAAYEANRGLGDPDEIVEVLLVTLKDLSLAEGKVAALDEEIKILEETLGSDQGAQRPHDFRNSSFALPTPCDHCKSSIWGLAKPGSSCRRCGANVHVKCAKRVPAECTGANAAATSSSNKRMSRVFSRRDTSPNQSISDLASIASASKDDSSSLRNIRKSFTLKKNTSENPTPD